MPRLLALLALSLSVACAGPGAGDDAAVFGPGGVRLDEAGLVAALRGADVVVLGEVHDNPVHHARQARLVRALAPGGLALEMVPERSEAGIAEFLAQGGDPDEIGPAIGWARLGWPDWALYAPVFAAAFAAVPEVYFAGAAPPANALTLARRVNAAAAWGRGAGLVGLDRALAPDTRRAREEAMIAAHCDMIPRPVARGMVEAQRFKDARLAAAALRALGRGGAPVVVIAGNGHARTDHGVPAVLAGTAPSLTVRAVGMVELDRGADAGADPAEAARGLPYDYVWVSVAEAAAEARGDPCAGFAAEGG